jgi:hypothetical protein
MSYRQVGDALIKRGIKPKRAARWNPIVLSRMVKGIRGLIGAGAPAQS